MKTCSKCATPKSEDEFSARGTGLRGTCRACISADNLFRYHNKESTRAAHRVAARKYGLKRYGLTLDSFTQMHSAQNGLCDICFKAIEVTHEKVYMSTAVDHCHTTGKVRGLLCWDCNIGLGKFFDNPQRLRDAADYLERTA